MFTLTTGELAAKLGAELAGAADVVLSGVADLATAGAGQVSFAGGGRYLAAAAASAAAAVIVPRDAALAGAKPVLLRVANVDAAFAAACALFAPPPVTLPRGVHPQACVSPEAKLGADVAVGAFAVVEAGAELGAGTTLYPQTYVGHAAKLGRDCLLYPFASVRERCELGDRVILHNGAVIGSDGFGYAVDAQGVRTKIPQTGIVVLEDDVEIGANTTIDRARFGQTRVGRGTKVDNLVQIAHNCVIGPHTVLAGCTGVAGSVTMGEHCIVGGAGMISGHVTLAPGTTISGGSLVMKSINQPGLYTSVFPLDSHDEWVRNAAHIRRLSHLAERVSELEKKLKEMSVND